MSFWSVEDYDQKGWTTWIWWRDENRLFQMRWCLFLNWTGDILIFGEETIIWFKWIRSIKWEDVKNGKPNNSEIVSNELKWSLKNVKCYFWWRSIEIESFERKCIRSYALNWGYFNVWCDGNWGINGVIKCFNWIELFFVLFLFTGTKNMARLP